MVSGTISRPTAFAIGVAVFALSVFGPVQRARAADTPDLTFDVVGGQTDCIVGTITVHTARSGIGKDSGGRTGFTPTAGDGTLQDAANCSGETSFNWLQIVTAQPARQQPSFGPTPHIDPTLTRDGKPNPLSSGQPWYFKPNELPPLSSNFLRFSDYPTVRVGDTYSFDTYLVSFYTGNLYDVVSGFTWSAVGTDQGLEVSFHEISGFSHDYEQLVSSYNKTGWEYYHPRNEGVPEPVAWWLMTLGLAGVGAAARARRSTELTG
jgi:hypothetical protein